MDRLFRTGVMDDQRGFARHPLIEEPRDLFRVVPEVLGVQSAPGLELAGRRNLRERRSGLERHRRDRFAHAPQYRQEESVGRVLTGVRAPDLDLSLGFPHLAAGLIEYR